MIARYLTKNFYINSVIVLLIFILDRFSKIYVLHLDKINYSPELYQSKYLNKKPVLNLILFFSKNFIKSNEIDGLLLIGFSKKKFFKGHR